jgi:hypothetical protein
VTDEASTWDQSPKAFSSRYGKPDGGFYETHRYRCCFGYAAICSCGAGAGSEARTGIKGTGALDWELDY